MLNLRDHFEGVFIGKHYLSYILAIASRSDCLEDLLFIEDRLKKQPKFWLIHISEIEKKFLYKVGKKKNIKCLLDLDNYIKQMEVFFDLEDRSLFHGSTPYENLLELLRKFDFSSELRNTFFESIDVSGFNQDYDLMVEYIASSMIDEGEEKNVGVILDLLFNQSSSRDFFKKLHREFSSLLKTDEALRNLFFDLKLLFHTNIIKGFSDIDIMFAFLKILSPVYFLNDKLLEKDLKLEFQVLSRITKQANVKEIQVMDGKAHNLLLSSFEGRIGFENLFYNSVEDEKINQSCLYNIRLHIPLAGHIKNVQKTIDHQLRKIGDFYSPCIVIDYNHHGLVWVDIVLEWDKVVHLNHIRSELIEVSYECLEKNFGKKLSRSEDIQVEFGEERWRVHSKATGLSKLTNPDLSFGFTRNMSLSGERKDKNVFDLGPWYDHLFGLTTYYVRAQKLLKSRLITRQ